MIQNACFKIILLYSVKCGNKQISDGESNGKLKIFILKQNVVSIHLIKFPNVIQYTILISLSFFVRSMRFQKVYINCTVVYY